MKKLVYILCAALILGACAKGQDAIIGSYGLGASYGYTSSPAGEYLMCIADQLVTGALEELETAIKQEAGSVTWPSLFPGMTFTPGLEDQWLISYVGPFSIREGNSYETSFQILATREALPEGVSPHCTWSVQLDGNRIERGGYACQFQSVGEARYVAEPTTSLGWSKVYGKFTMLVTKNGQKVDNCVLTFTGIPSEAQFIRNL